MTEVLLTLSVVAVLGAFFAWLNRKRKKRAARSPYLDALHLLLDNRTDEALEKLKRTVRVDTDNIMAYIKLGDIFRLKGYPVRASKIHRNLLLRTTLTEEESAETLHHLVLDYRAANLLDKAVEMAERLSPREKKNLEIRKVLLELYEDKQDWDKAFFVRQSINQWVKKGDQKILALYKVNAGLELIRKGAEHQGRIRYREALKLDRKCVPAVLSLGDSYVREGRHEDALKVWKEFVAKHPEQAHLFLDRLDNVLYHLGRYGELEDICENIIRAKPAGPGPYFKLIDIYEKQGKISEALDLCRQAHDVVRDSPRAHFLLVRFLKLAGKTDKALDEALAVFQNQTEKTTPFTCERCGHASKDLAWRCPECKQWNTFLPEK
jgi:lipopolysaccharide biosynthesis regulator YciM